MRTRTTRGNSGKNKQENSPIHLGEVKTTAGGELQQIAGGEAKTRQWDREKAVRTLV